MRGYSGYALPLLAGAGAGLAVGLGVWWFARRQLERELAAGGDVLGSRLGAGRAELTARLAEGRRQIEAQLRAEVARQVPPVVDRQIRSTLASYGLTPDNTRRIVTAADYVLRLGA